MTIFSHDRTLSLEPPKPQKMTVVVKKSNTNVRQASPYLNRESPTFKAEIRPKQVLNAKRPRKVFTPFIINSHSIQQES